MRTLDLHEMENIDGGNCALSAIGWGLTIVGLFVMTPMTGGAAALFAGSYIVGGLSTMSSCFYWS